LKCKTLFDIPRVERRRNPLPLFKVKDIPSISSLSLWERRGYRWGRGEDTAEIPSSVLLPSSEREGYSFQILPLPLGGGGDR